MQKMFADCMHCWMKKPITQGMIVSHGQSGDKKELKGVCPECKKGLYKALNKEEVLLYE